MKRWILSNNIRLWIDLDRTNSCSSGRHDERFDPNSSPRDSCCVPRRVQMYCTIPGHARRLKIATCNCELDFKRNANWACVQEKRTTVNAEPSTQSYSDLPPVSKFWNAE